MCSSGDDMPITAYRNDTAHDYDTCRFTTRQGRLFADLELEQLDNAIRGLSPRADVLEVGCGTARFSQHLATLGFSVVATDPSPDMLDLASRKCADLKTITFQQAEGAGLPFADGVFDFVFAIRVLNQTESEAYAVRTVQEMTRVTRAGGLLLLEFVNSRRPLARRSRDIRLSFPQLDRVACQCGCDVLSRRGVLVFSQSILNRIPDVLVSSWGLLERIAATMLWRWASRGYVLLRKR